MKKLTCLLSRREVLPVRVRWLLSLLVTLPLVTAGCGRPPEATFVLSERTKTLIPDARELVEQALDENFGTPQRLVAWERLPVDYGGEFGQVTAATSEENSPPTLTVTFEKENPKLAPHAKLLWISGANKGTEQTLASSDTQANSGTLKLEAAPENPPSAGDRFAVNFGHVLQLGRMAYMKNCVHCHGVSGDGAGPTAQYLSPRPRDYRQGVFKFTSTLSGEKATREDLARTVKYGIPGTYMPSFLLLTDDELHSVVEYVRWLAMRGELENSLVNELAAEYSTQAYEDQIKSLVEEGKQALADWREKGKAAGEPEPNVVRSRSEARTQILEGSLAENGQREGGFSGFVKDDYPGIFSDTADFMTQSWQRAEDPASLVIPAIARVEDTPESRQRGRLLFLSDKTKCYTCHGENAKGNGSATEDFWKDKEGKPYPERGLHDTWGFVQKPRDLTRGIYRGGRRPLDLYRRVHAGIKGTQMPAFSTGLKPEEMWDIVNYVMGIPFEEQQPSSGHAKPPQVARN